MFHSVMRCYSTVVARLLVAIIANPSATATPFPRVRAAGTRPNARYGEGSLRRRQDLHPEMRTGLRRVIHPLGRFLEILFAGLVDVAKLLRVAVHQRKP